MSRPRDPGEWETRSDARPPFTVDCPECGFKVPVDLQTMRRLPPLEKVVHLGRPAPAGDSDWPEPEPAA